MKSLALSLFFALVATLSADAQSFLYEQPMSPNGGTLRNSQLWVDPSGQNDLDSDAIAWEDFTLPQCDGAGYRLYGADFCAPEHTLTVVNIAAEWCGPCQAESSVMTETLVRSYAARGVRVIQILIQDRDYGPPTLELCDRWVARYNLTDNVEVIDPTGITSGSFPSGSLPSSLIIDETGTILYREDGASDALVTLRAELDRALAGM